MNEVELYQQYIDAKETIQAYIDRFVIPVKGSSFEDDMHVFECLCTSLLRKIAFIREYEKTH